jgi:hypothetical protein
MQIGGGRGHRPADTGIGAVASEVDLHVHGVRHGVRRVGQAIDQAQIQQLSRMQPQDG